MRKEVRRGGGGGRSRGRGGGCRREMGTDALLSALEQVTSDNFLLRRVRSDSDAALEASPFILQRRPLCSE